MKRLLVISATAAFAALSTTACNSTGDGTSSYTDFYIMEKEEVSSDGVIKTMYERDDMAVVTKETVTRSNGDLVYEISGYLREGNTVTCYRTNADGSRHKLSSTYGNSYRGRPLETKYEEFLMTGENADTTPVKRTDFGYDEQGRMNKMEDYENGVLVHWRKDFFYYESEGYTYDEWKTGYPEEGLPVLFKVTEYSNIGTVIGFEIWSGYYNEDDKGTLIEEVTDYLTETNTISYKVTKLDDDGNETVTSVTEKYEQITVTLQ